MLFHGITIRLCLLFKIISKRIGFPKKVARKQFSDVLEFHNTQPDVICSMILSAISLKLPTVQWLTKNETGLRLSSYGQSLRNLRLIWFMTSRQRPYQFPPGKSGKYPASLFANEISRSTRALNLSWTYQYYTYERVVKTIETELALLSGVISRQPLSGTFTRIINKNAIVKSVDRAEKAARQIKRSFLKNENTTNIVITFENYCRSLNQNAVKIICLLCLRTPLFEFRIASFLC